MKKKNGVSFYQDSKKEWRWKVYRNGRIIGASTEGYKRRFYCERNARMVKKYLNV